MSGAVLVPIPRALLEAVIVEFVSQHTSQATFGLPPERFIKLCKNGEWPAKRDGHLWLAKAADVRSYAERDLKVHSRSRRPSSSLDEVILPTKTRRHG